MKGLRVPSTEGSYLPSMDLWLFLFCKSGLRIKIYSDVCLGHCPGGSSLMEADGRIQITYLVTVVQIDGDKSADFRQSHTFAIRLGGEMIFTWDAGMGVSEFRLLMDQTTGDANKVRTNFPCSWT